MTTTYKYGADGLRTQKKVGSTTYNYYYADGLLVRQTWGSNYMDFLYDESGSAYSFIYNGTQYYYLKNLQGDVVRILNTSGTTVVAYSYDAWGKCTITSGASNAIANANPIRYRGYYYDTETGFYYLQSRYYDPTVKRFISADGVISGVGGELLGYNQYAYCLNNPINMIDETGSWPKWAEKLWRALGGNMLEAAATSVELEAGVGWGLDINLSNNVTIGMSRDTFVGIDDGMLTTGNTITAEASILDSDVSIGDSYRFVSEKGGVKSSSGTAADGPFDMINYPDVERGKQFAAGIFAISDSGDFLISIEVGAHVVIGGHLSASFNVSEYLRRLFD